MAKNILFVTYGGGHAHMVAPVVHELRKTKAHENGDIAIHVLGLSAAKGILKRADIESFGFKNYLDKDKDADAISWGEELAKTHHVQSSGIELADSIAYLGLSYKDLVIRLGEEEAERLLQKEARRAFYPLTIMERIFDYIKPDFVIATNSPRSEAAAIATANKRGIDNLIMTDLFAGWVNYPLKAKHITFINEFAKNGFAADSLVDEESSQLYYTGNPAFDAIIKLPKNKDGQWMAKHFPQISGKKIILHADMPAYWDTEKKCSHFKSDAETLEELNACYHAAAKNGAVYLIRPHPSQDHGLYNKWLEGKDGAYLAADCDLHELLRNIDLLIARSTTVGLEAATMQKRIVQLDSDFHSDLPLAKMGVAWGVNSYDELADTIKNALSDDKSFEKIKDQIKQLLPSEPAAAKIAKIILENIA